MLIFNFSAEYAGHFSSTTCAVIVVLKNKFWNKLRINNSVLCSSHRTNYYYPQKKHISITSCAFGRPRRACRESVGLTEADRLSSPDAFLFLFTPTHIRGYKIDGAGLHLSCHLAMGGGAPTPGNKGKLLFLLLFIHAQQKDLLG